MNALIGMNSASALLQQIANNVTPVAGKQAADKQNSDVSMATMVSDASVGNWSAEKSVSSAIFNAVVSTTEEQDRTVKAVIEFVEREYINFDKKFANIVQRHGDEEGFQKSIIKIKEFGERLKQIVLSDPAGTHQLLEQIKASRPTMSQDGVIGILVVELGQRHGRQAASGL